MHSLEKNDGIVWNLSNSPSLSLNLLPDTRLVFFDIQSCFMLPSLPSHKLYHQINYDLNVWGFFSLSVLKLNLVHLFSDLACVLHLSNMYCQYVFGYLHCGPALSASVREEFAWQPCLQEEWAASLFSGKSILKNKPKLWKQRLK